MTTPIATARLQLHAEFTLHDARKQLPYYAALGISHLYLSPISTAKPGSTHGYDVVDHTHVNPELGGMDALRELTAQAREHDMGLILDIVPNHMATHANNRWWWDVLRHGADSEYATWFDIDWRSPDPALRGKVLLPFLADAYGQNLADGGIKLVADEVGRSFEIEACGTRYPVAPNTLHAVGLGAEQVLKRYDSAQTDGRQRLHELLERQHYRLCWWRCAADSINWRRFFEVSELIGVRVEYAAVFDAVHALPLALFADGLIDGLRVDHVDGLSHPVAYCRKLSAALAERQAFRPGKLSQTSPWLVVEKILAPDEVLGDEWQVDGTSGYDFMDQVGAVLHDPSGEAALTTVWHRTAQDTRPPEAYKEEARRLMLQRHFVAERRGLVNCLTGLARADIRTRDWGPDAIARVLDEVLVRFPVYRTYVDADGRSPADTELVTRVFDEVRLALAYDKSLTKLLDALDGWLGGESITSGAVPGIPPGDLQYEAIRRFQQLTPPLAAKSLEDTVFYRYGRLLSRNEVGSEPSAFALNPDAFHEQNMWRVRHAPRSMLATATHDHKRGEDVRARLALLSEVPDLWARACDTWMQWPDTGSPLGHPTQAAERYMLFQTLVGAWPLLLSVDDKAGVQDYLERVAQWQLKALREAKQNSNWFEPDLQYEANTSDFIASLEPGERNYELLRAIQSFSHLIAPAGALNSLVQTVLRVTAPGVPDLYQGTDLWDFSLVDPDNRRPVDFAARSGMLAALDAPDAPDNDALLADWKSGHIKQAVLVRALRIRRQMPQLFGAGEYAALPVQGTRAAHVLAFLRRWQDQYALVLVPRLCFNGVVSGQGRATPSLNPRFWGDTAVLIPDQYGKTPLRNVLQGRVHDWGAAGSLQLADVFAGLPLALLVPA